MERAARILVVEDTDSWQEIFGEILLAQGYSVSEASTLKEAKQLLDRQAFDTAIVDIRLSEGDATNQDGMQVLEVLRRTNDPTSTIIVSGTATATLARDAIIEFDALDIIEKDLFDESEFLRVVDRAVQESRAIGYGDRSLYDLLLSEPGRAVQKTSYLPGSRQILESLLRKMLTDLWPLSTASGSFLRLGEAFEGEPIVQLERWSKGIGSAIVVRIGRNKLIKRESQNYNKYVKGLDESDRATIKREPVYQENLGGLVYVVPGANTEAFEDFSAFYVTANTFNILEALKDLFWRVCANLYLSAGIDTAKVDLSARYHSTIEQAVAYQKSERDEEEYYVNQLEKAERQDFLKTRERQRRQGVNPIDFVQKRRFIFESPVGIVHGDLHGGNVLVDTSTRVWLVGFYDTGSSDILLEESASSSSVPVRAYQAGKGNLLHDFASLEMSIRRTLTFPDNQVARAFDLALCEPRDFGEPFSFEAPANLPQLDKASKVIARIRELASEIVDFRGDMQLYYSELLLQLLNSYMRLQHQAEKDRIWASAAVLANRLDKWS